MLAAAQAQDGPLASGVKFLSPQEAIDKMTYPEGFKVQAFAAEPMIVQPFAFTFDDKGRVWLLENINYQTRGSDTFDQGPQGRIVVLTDEDGDGIADKKTLFKDKIFFPTGIAVGHGGVWVGSPPNLLFIPDADADLVPDGEPEIKLDGWGRQDRHETLNSFLWGPDGWLYGCHGVFTHSRVGKPGTPDEERQPINAGVWRYHPIKDKFEVFAWGTSNPWGMDFDRRGQMFLTACVIPHLWHISQGGRYHRQAGQHFNPHVYNDIKTIADHKHASAHGGARFYNADQFPERYHGKLFMCNIHEHGVLVDDTQVKGSGYVGSHHEHFCMANDPQWLGFNMELGPDGSMFVIDWHDEDICGRKVMHLQTGRLFRISYADAKYAVKADVSELTDAQLVECLADANEWLVRQAQLELHERAVAKKLEAGTHGKLLEVLDANPEPARQLRALWALHVTGGADSELLSNLLEHSDDVIRAWTIQLMAEDGEVASGDLERWAEMAANDESPFVRLYLASALQRIPGEQGWPILENLVQHAADNEDHNLPLMYWYALEPLVVENSERAVQLAANSKVHLLSRYVARRLTSEVPATGPAVVVDGAKASAADSVSDEGLTLHLSVDEHAGLNEPIANWGPLKQERAWAQPTARESIGGRRAIFFDGKDDRLEMPPKPEYYFKAEDSFALMTWAYLERPTKGWDGIVTFSRDRSPWYGLWIDGSGRWFSGQDHLVGPIAGAGWRHLAMVQIGGQKREFYVDGYRVGEKPASNADGGGWIWVGGAVSVNEPFRGGISDVRLYSRALSPGEISFLADNPVGVTGDPSDDSAEGAFAELITMLGNAEAAETQLAVLNGIRDGLAGNASAATPETWTSTYASISKSENTQVREAAKELSVIFGDEASLAALRDIMMNRELPGAERGRALETLVQKRVPGLAKDLRQLLSHRAVRRAAIHGLAIIPDEENAAAILQHYSEFDAQEKIDAINTLAARPQSGMAILEALQNGDIPSTDVNATAARQLHNLNNADISAKLAEVWGNIRPTPAEKRELFNHYRRVLNPNNLRKADIKNGRAVYDKSCGQCHVMFDKGGDIGPDITGSDRRNVEYILENVLDPNGAIGNDYQYSTFILNDDRVVLGIISEENDKSVTVKTLAGPTTISKAEIKTRDQLPSSMMPESLFQTLTDTDVRDLVKYLQSEEQVEP